jgi:LysM repeat protein
VADDPNAASRPMGDRTPGSARPPGPSGGDGWTADDVLADAGVRSIGAADPPDARAVPEPSTWLPALKGRSSTPGICPFLRAVGPDAAIGLPVETPDVANRCAALREPVPQSLRQQELVCLTASHINCPRYLRGALVAAEAPVGRVRVRSALTPAITAALVVLVLSFGASVGFVVANGGLTLPVAASVAPSATTAALGPSAEPTALVTPRASAAPSPAPASPSTTPTSTPTAVPDPTPKPTKTAKPEPTSNRYALLTACPNKPNCWIYVIRSGDNLFSIANYFGVPLERVKALNPWTRTERLRAGRQLILPPPTR